VTLTWSCADPNQGDSLTYDVYWDSSNPPSNKVVADQPVNSLYMGGLSYSSTYYWRITAKDNHGAETSGPVWRFATGPITSTPYLVSPANGAIGVPINPTVFVWSHVTFLKAPIVPVIGPNPTHAPVSENLSSRGLAAASPAVKIASLPQSQNALRPTPLPVNKAVNRSGVKEPITERPVPSSPVPLALTYQIQVSTDSGFGNKVVDQSNLTDTTYSTNVLSLATTYYWRVRATEGVNAGPWSTIGSFLTNRPPNVPNTPSPADGATNQPVSLTLSWTGGDPDPGDTAKYDVYFDTVNPPVTRVSTGQLGTTLLRSGLNRNTTYFWKIMAIDNHGAQTSGPVWSFATIPLPWFILTSGTTNGLTSVNFPVDAQTGYAVGIFGTILKTTNGGANWVSQSSGTTNDLWSVHFPMDTQTGYVVGYDHNSGSGAILKTTNGGANWVSQTSGTTHALPSVYFPGNTQTGYAVGDSGTILKTTNGGANWVSQSSGTTNDLLSAHFSVDVQTGYVAGWTGTILKTTNGGVNWTSQSSGTTNGLYSVHFPVDVQTGYAVGNGGTILKTTDGGANWVSQTSGSTDELESVRFPVDTQTGYVVGYDYNSSSGAILKTTNGGANWVSQSSGTTNNLISVQFPGNVQTGYATGSGGTILKTITGGN
jgi:photosystem II stability/assembly factor-like uncharacterized protein